MFYLTLPKSVHSESPASSSLAVQGLLAEPAARIQELLAEAAALVNLQTHYGAS